MCCHIVIYKKIYEVDVYLILLGVECCLRPTDRTGKHLLTPGKYYDSYRHFNENQSTSMRTHNLSHCVSPVRTFNYDCYFMVLFDSLRGVKRSGRGGSADDHTHPMPWKSPHDDTGGPRGAIVSLRSLKMLSVFLIF